MFTDLVIVRMTIGCLATVVGIPGNLVIVGIFTRQGIKNATDVTFIALAVVDLIASIINGMKIVMVFYHDEHPWACFIEVVAARSALYAGLFLTIWIAVYRYQAVCRPFNKRIGRKTATLIAIGCAVVAFVLHIPFFFITTSIKLGSEYGCNVYGNIPWGRDVYAKTQAIVFCVSAFAISVLYVRIYRFIRAHQIIRQQLTNGSAFVGRDLAKTVNDKTLPAPPAIPSVSASCATVTSTSEPDDTNRQMTAHYSLSLNNELNQQKPVVKAISNAEDAIELSRQKILKKSASNINISAESRNDQTPFQENESVPRAISNSISLFAVSKKKTRSLTTGTKSIKDTGKTPHHPTNDKTKPLSSKHQNTQSDHRTTRVVIMVTVIFFILWLPNIIIDQVPFHQLNRVFTDTKKGLVIIYTFYQIKYISHITNVFIYSFAYRRFRQTCCKIFHSQ
ncbi:uncharacterized protein LOC121425255 [Lytechinus variegatus]|uniref:uncharacterized protein LOC121425255 n=1 Tax=Lytechinus variegatus TaxID=7654 RepID=UPI001BB0FEC0|nr:uncharacterized protein LOC121425255 [Lytechinus variegatus]